MYESYWQLREKPFENTSDPRFYYPSEVHQGALLKLRYVIENRRGGALLAGGAGLGKTLLVQSLIRQLPDTFAPVVHVVFPQMPQDQLLAYLADELTGGQPASSSPSVERSVRWIEHALEDNTKAGRHAVVVVDEAHLLHDTGALESMRLLLNFELASRPGLTLLLVGHPSLLPVLDRMPGLEERLGVKCLLRPFQMEETISYVSHRLTAAGAQRTIFDPQALEAVHHLSQGVPRRINRLCDLAMLISYAEEQQTILAVHVEAVSEELVAVRPE
jgi:general secretion pathway protein A